MCTMYLNVSGTKDRIKTVRVRGFKTVKGERQTCQKFFLSLDCLLQKLNLDSMISHICEVLFFVTSVYVGMSHVIVFHLTFQSSV